MTHSISTALGRRSAWAAAMTLALLAPAYAQQQPNPAVQQFGPRLKQPVGQAQQRAKPAVVATHGDWVLQCEKEAAQAQAQASQTAANAEGATKSDAGVDNESKDQRACGMVQTARNEERKNIALTLVLISGQQQGKPVTMMRVMAPIGVFLPTGVALEIDGAAVGRVPFTRCLPQVCIAFAEATPQTLEKLKKGTKANFIIYEAPGLGITMQLSLKGFTAGLDALSKL